MFYLSQINRFIERVIGGFIALLLFSMSILLFVNVIGRYFLGFSFPWSEELTNYSIIWITFLGSGICVRKKIHVNVDLLFQYITGVPMKVIYILILIGSLSFVLFMGVTGLKLVNGVYSSGQLSTALRIPMYIPYLALPLGGLFMALEFAELIFKELKQGGQ